jgi:hypothetical protein
MMVPWGLTKSEPASPLAGAGRGNGAKLAFIADMAPAQRFKALEQLDPALRAQLLGASALSPHVHERGPAYDFPWDTFHITAGYSGEQAWAASIISRRAYEAFGESGNDPERVGRGFADLARAGFTIEFLRGKGGTHAAVVHRGDDVFVVFRGTDPRVTTDLLKDADAMPVPHQDGGRAHKGFQRGVAEVSDQLSTYLQGLRQAQPGMRVLLTGHSLGAAMATLAALDLNRQGFPVCGVYNYGSPRVMDPALARIYKERGLDAMTYRFRKGWDGVVDVPPPIGYQHVGTEIYFTVNGGMLVKPTDRAIRTDQFIAMGSAISKQWVLQGEPEMLWDHGPGGYVKHCYVNRDVAPAKLTSA